MSKIEKEDDDEKKLNGISAFIFLVVACTWAASWIGIDSFITDPQVRGQFGDKFGSINSLFSGLAFAGLIYAILLQRIELKLQRRELELTREEMKGQRGEFEEQNKTLRRQRFENTFFQMLSLHNEITNSSESGFSSGVYRGRMVFSQIGERLRDQIERVCGQTGAANINQISFDQYAQYYNHHQNVLGRYFRSLYRMIQMVDQSDVEDKNFYIDLIKAQLSDREIQLIFYEGLTDRAAKLKIYIENYALLNSINHEYIYQFDEIMNQYSDSAFPRSI